MATKEESALMGALGTVISVLAKIEKVWEQRLLSDKAVEQVSTDLSVTKQFKYGKDGEWTPPDVKEEILAVHRYITQPATVGLEMGATLNMGVYESARVSVNVTVPCYREETEAAYAWCRDFVEERFKKEVAEARNVNAETKKKPSSPF